MVSFDVGRQVSRELPLLRQRQDERQGRAAVLSQLALHFACFFLNISTLVVYYVFEQMKFFWTLFSAWILCGAFVSWAALKELRPRDSERCWVLRWIWIVVVFGLFRGLQVRHICRFFRQRQSGEGDRRSVIEPTAFNAKTFDGIIEGLVFAIGNQLAFFELDIAPPDCDWYSTRRFEAACPTCPRLRFFFLFSAYCSKLSLAAAIVEVDYRVSTDIRWRINESSLRGLIHFAYRASEVLVRLSAVNLVCIFLRPQPCMQNSFGSYLLYMPFAIIWLVSACILYNSARRHSAEQEFLIAHAVVALASIAVNPTQFVDRPIYIVAAKSTAKAFFVMHLVELTAMWAFINWYWTTPFPASCGLSGHPEPDRPTTIGPYTLWSKSNNRVAYVELSAALMLRLIIILIQPYTRDVCKVCDEPEHNLRRADSGGFLASTSAESTLQAEVRKTVPRGLSSFLVQAGTGVTSKLFTNREYAMTDFSIEKVLGSGCYGVVVLVKALWRGGEPLPAERRQLYAMKLANVSNERQALYAEREREYLVKLHEHNHPFIMRLEHFFDLPPDQQFEDADGVPIQVGRGGCCFHRALMMEYCPQGDLEGYLKRVALEAPGQEQPPAPDAEGLQVGLQWLENARRLCAQLVEAVRFLHAENFIHRDLKPGNVLMKTGPLGLHVCITDFGFAKQLAEGQPLESAVGDFEYMAPEIQRIYATGQWRGDPYSPAVDLWSLGKMILVLLWDTKWSCRNPNLLQPIWLLQLPQSRWIAGPEGHPRVPVCALELVETMMQDEAEDRGTAADLARHPFFKALDHRGMAFPPLDFSNCQRQATARRPQLLTRQGSRW